MIELWLAGYICSILAIVATDTRNGIGDYWNWTCLTRKPRVIWKGSWARREFCWGCGAEDPYGVCKKCGSEYISRRVLSRRELHSNLKLRWRVRL